MKKKTRSFMLVLVSISFLAILLIATLLIGQTKTAFADLSKNYSDNIFYDENIENHIVKDSVIITLTEKETKKFKTYLAKDFKEVGCVEVEDLTPCTTNYVMRKARGYSVKEARLVETKHFKRILKLTLDDEDVDNVFNALKVLNKRKDVLVAEPDYIDTLNLAPNDVYWDNNGTWGLNGTNGIQAETAWNVTTGANTVTVGVLDSGIQANHPDLANRISTAGLHRDFTVDPEAIVTNDNLIDPVGHGTHVAGIIGAQGNNALGTSGVCWDVRLVSLRVFDEYGNGNKNYVYRAIDYAAMNDIPILNYSGGGKDENINVKYALDFYKGLFVCSAGNGNENHVGVDNDTSQYYPSNYSYNQSCSDKVISVGALNVDGDRTTFSNYGAQSVSIFAPGEDILSTFPQVLCTGKTVQTTNDGKHLACECIYLQTADGKWVWEYTGSTHHANGYHYMSGTSMATPYVTGVAALLLSLDPSMTGAQLKQAILKGADACVITLPEGKGSQTVKKLNAFSALRQVNRSVLFPEGDGSKSNPYLISNEQQFRYIGLAYDPVYVPYEGNVLMITSAFKLTKSITISEDWAPFTYKFCGDFDGGGYYITYSMHLTQKDLDTSAYQGLFGVVGSGGTIHDLELMNCAITSDTSTTLSSSDGQVDIGMVAGVFYDSSRLTDVTVTNPKIECKISNACIGAISGTFYSGRAENCVVWAQSTATASITNNTRGNLGGMAGLGSVYLFRGCSVTISLINTSFDKNNDKMGIVVGNNDDSAEVLEEEYGIIADVTMNTGGKCLAEGTLITLADGSQVPVESLTGNEMLLVWNLQTGSFDIAPILFIDSDPRQSYQVINLAFSDGTSVKVIYEHGFWDYDLNQYVYLRDDAAQYIGHWFNKQTTDENGNFVSQRVQLTGVVVQTEYTAAYSPVTYGHLCYYVNGMLSMPGGIDGLFNTFEVDPETMSYDWELMQADIAEYGLFTYDEFVQLVPVTEEVFNAFNGQYLKVAIGKGMISIERLQELVERYQQFF